MKQVFADIQRTSSAKALALFGNNVDRKLTILFKTDGTIKFTDGSQTTLVFLPNVTLPAAPKLYEDGNTIVLEYALSTYHITFQFVISSASVKITISGELPNPQIIQLPMKFQMLNSESEVLFDVSPNTSGSRLQIGCFERRTKQLLHGLEFDWSDITGATFVASALAVPVSSVFTLDPVVIITSNIWYGTQSPFHVKGFYAEGKFWEFVLDSDAHVQLYNSTDGITWTWIEEIYSGTLSNFTVAYDPLNKQCVFLITYFIGDIWTGYMRLRMGYVSSSGISWQSWSNLLSELYVEYDWPTLNLYVEPLEPTYIYVNIGYNRHFDDGVSFVEEAYVLRGKLSSGGGWNVTTGFPFRLQSNNAYPYYYVVFFKQVDSFTVWAIWSWIQPPPLTELHQVRRRLWTGSWGTTANIESVTGDGISPIEAIACSLSAQDLHIAWLRKTGSAYSFYYSSLGDAFAVTANLVTGLTTLQRPSIGCIDNDVYLFWAKDNHIFYKKRDGTTGIWDSNVDWIDESTEVLTYNGATITTFERTCTDNPYPIIHNAHVLGVMYVTKTSAPYNIKFAYLGTLPPPPVVVVEDRSPMPHPSISVSVSTR